jgi:predicted nuclease of restriction endonuclease-like (RecB) superfamily
MSKLSKISDTELDQNLFEQATRIISESRVRVINQIYKESAITYFELGKAIVETEQQGSSTTEYGSKILNNLSRKLSAKFGRGYSVTSLKDARRFYNTYKIGQTVSAPFNFELSFSHYLELCKLNINERVFYEQIAIREKYDVRDLKRAIETNLALRALQHPEDLKALSQKQIPTKPSEVIRDPYVADYLGIKEIKSGDESKVEQAIIDNLESFLMDLGRGFAFVGRQYKINLSGSVYKSDLVFYNIILKRYVIFELKARTAQHKDIGQLQMYVNYFDRDICLDTDNNTIGVLLCTKQNKTVIDYTLPLDNKSIFTSELMMYLPTKEELTKLINDKK